MSFFLPFLSYERIVSISVFLFFSLMLTIPSGYSYGAALLLVTSLTYLTRTSLRNAPPHIGTADKWIIATLLSIFVVTGMALIMHGNRAEFLDQSTRCLLAVPVMILLIKVPPRLCAVWAGIIVGTVGAAMVAFWQVHYMGIERATGFVTSAIPFGDISLAMGVFCIPGLFWARYRGNSASLWRFALLLGTSCGLYGSLASGSRGGWLAMMPVGLVLCATFTNRQNIKQAGVVVVLCTAAITALIIVPDSTIRARYELAMIEAGKYLKHDHVATSVGARLEAWRAASLLIKERPIQGWSVADYQAKLKQLAADKRVHPYVLELSNVHNNFLQVWLTQGVVGLLALVALFLVPLWQFCQRLRFPDPIVKAMASCGACLTASFFSFSLTQVILGRNNGIMFFVICLAVFWSCMRNREITFNAPAIHNPV